MLTCSTIDTDFRNNLLHLWGRCSGKGRTCIPAAGTKFACMLGVVLWGQGVQKFCLHVRTCTGAHALIGAHALMIMHAYARLIHERKIMN